MKVGFRGRTSGFYCLLWFVAINAVFLTVTYLGAQIIENPSKPPVANAGRVVTPKEVLIIEDIGEKYYFKYPNALKTGPDGSIFVIDENQFLQFDPGGKFLRNLYKKGQGPGEMMRMSNYAFDGDNVVAFSDQPAKLVWYDKNGKYYRNETLPPESGFLSFHGRIGGRWTFSTFELSRQSGEPVLINIPNQIIAWDELKKEWIPLSSFPILNYFVPPGASISLGNFIVSPFGDHYLAISHTPEYLIKILDVKSNKIVRSFRRNYRRVPPLPLKPGQSRGRIIMEEKTYEPPPQKYENDIFNIIARSDLLWVVTSTMDKKKGILIDVFDAQGIFRDSFYLNLQEPALNAIRYSGTSALVGDALLTIERNEEGTFAIKKYKIKE